MVFCTRSIMSNLILRRDLTLVTLTVIAAVGPPAACRGDVGAQLLLDLSGGAFGGSSYTQIEQAPGRPNDLFIARQDGIIVRVDLTTNTQSTFLTLPDADIDSGCCYWGLLGFTFAPDFATSGEVYVHVSGDRPNPGGPGPARHPLSQHHPWHRRIDYRS